MIRILALGDSYTIGEGVLAAERWPAQLADRLRAAGWGAEEPVIIAQTGWTTDELAAAIRRWREQTLTSSAPDPASGARPGSPFDLVTLLIGVNNQYRGRDLEEYRAQFRDLLRQAIAFAGERPGRVLVLSIPDWGATPFGATRGPAAQKQIAAQIDAFNEANRAESQAAGARYGDITLITRQKSGAAGWLASDGLHPSGRMYGAWVEQLWPVVVEAIR